MNLVHGKNRAVFGILLVLSLLCGCGREIPADPTQASTAAQIRQPAQQLRQGVETVLLISTRPFEPEQGTGYRNPNMADLLFLLIMDQENGTISAVQVNPDIEVAFTAQGQAASTFMPLGEVLSFGSGGSDSFLQQIAAVSKLLGGCPIAHYMVLTPQAIGIVCEMVGMELQGDEAAEYFSGREESDLTNEIHMSRQREFMWQAYFPMAEAAAQENFLTRLTIRLGDQMATDMTLSQMVQFLEIVEQGALDDHIVTIMRPEDVESNVLDALLYGAF